MNKIDYSYYSKKTLSSATSQFDLNHFDQTSQSVSANIPTPNQFPRTHRFTLMKLMVNLYVVAKVAADSFIVPNLIAKLITGTRVRMDLGQTRVLDLPLSQILVFPNVGTIAGTPANSQAPVPDLSRSLQGEKILNVPVRFEPGATFNFVQTTDPASTDLSAIGIEFIMAGFLEVASEGRSAA